MRRIDELDWLRGLMALSILLFHSASFMALGWTTDSSSVLGRLGVYGVSIFFILSGLSMAHVYHASFTGTGRVAAFFVRRAFRIWPLLTFAVVLKAIPAWQSGHPFSVELLIANATGLFGFVWPTAYINAGAWSIGNEMVFYALTPILIFAYARSKTLGNVIVAAPVAVGVIFAFLLLDPAKTLPAQWATYVNPFNNLFLFASGAAIFYNMEKIEIAGKWRWIIFLVPIALFVLFPASGDRIHIVTGVGRTVLSIVSVMIVIGFYKAAPVLPAPISASLEKLGLVSYGVYLLHPFVIDAVAQVFGRQPPAALFVVCVCVASVVLALVIYTALERPFMKLGKTVTRHSVFRVDRRTVQVERAT